MCGGLFKGDDDQDSDRSALGFDFVTFYFFKQFAAVVVEVSRVHLNLNIAIATLELA